MPLDAPVTIAARCAISSPPLAVVVGSPPTEGRRRAHIQSRRLSPLADSRSRAPAPVPRRPELRGGARPRFPGVHGG
jgi:hypothetical protein